MAAPAQLLQPKPYLLGHKLRCEDFRLYILDEQLHVLCEGWLSKCQCALSQGAHANVEAGQVERGCSAKECCQRTGSACMRCSGICIGGGGAMRCGGAALHAGIQGRKCMHCPFAAAQCTALGGEVRG